MAIPWPAYRRPTARELKEFKEKVERDGPAPMGDSAPPWGAVTITVNRGGGAPPGDGAPSAGVAPSGGGAPSGGNVDMTESREKPAATEAKEAGKTATKASEDDKDTPILILTQAPDTPAMPVPPPAHGLPSHVEARSAILGIHDIAGPFAAPRNLQRPASSSTSTVRRRSSRRNAP